LNRCIINSKSMIKRKELENIECKLLAPYAIKSKNSKGRVYKEKEHDYRTCFQRDRDRIVHSTSFRRLEYKTQVFVNHEGDHYRTRLTHSIEVAQIARSIARNLQLNEDLCEAIALAHDLGHTPFGHSGEEILNKIMEKFGGFNHNTQGLRVVDMLERRYPKFPGLNLTYEVREGIAKHSSLFDNPANCPTFEKTNNPPLEAQVVNISDEIAYDSHDLDDGLTSNFIDFPDLNKIKFWKKASREISLKCQGTRKNIYKSQIISKIINSQVKDVITETKKRIGRFKIKSPLNARQNKEKIVCYSCGMTELKKEMRTFLMKNLYQHYKVVRMCMTAKRFIEKLFEFYLSNPKQLPPNIYDRTSRESVQRVICDYIAGMTDRYALDEYKKFAEPYQKL